MILSWFPIMFRCFGKCSSWFSSLFFRAIIIINCVLHRFQFCLVHISTMVYAIYFGTESWWIKTLTYNYCCMQYFIIALFTLSVYICNFHSPFSWCQVQSLQLVKFAAICAAICYFFKFGLRREVCLHLHHHYCRPILCMLYLLLIVYSPLSCGWFHQSFRWHAIWVRYSSTFGLYVAKIEKFHKLSWIAWCTKSIASAWI